MVLTSRHVPVVVVVFSVVDYPYLHVLFAVERDPVVRVQEDVGVARDVAARSR